MHKQYIVGTQKNRLNEDQNCLKIIFIMVPCKTLITCKKGKKKKTRLFAKKYAACKGLKFEPGHVNTGGWLSRDPDQPRDQPRYHPNSQIRFFTLCRIVSLGFLSFFVRASKILIRLKLADAHADLSLCWAHSWFCPRACSFEISVIEKVTPMSLLIRLMSITEASRQTQHKH